jgi:DNA repair protein RadA/Sms
MKEQMNIMKVERRGRPKKPSLSTPQIDPSTINLIRGNDLSFNDSLFKPFKTNTEMDLILSTEGGLMPGVSMMIAGGPGSGKSTLVLNMLSQFTQQGYKCLFIQGEMDEIGHYKYCKRIPSFGCVQTLFLKNHIDDVKEVIEYVLNLGYDVVALDSIAEVLDMYRAQNGGTAKQAETWFLKLQDNVKKGKNSQGYYTSFINIQQMTKSDDFVGSNRLKHMMESYCAVERSKDGLERTMHFDKNRDCDKDYKIFFSIYQDGVHFALNQEE